MGYHYLLRSCKVVVSVTVTVLTKPSWLAASPSGSIVIPAAFELIVMEAGEEVDVTAGELFAAACCAAFGEADSVDEADGATIPAAAMDAAAFACPTPGALLISADLAVVWLVRTGG